MQQTDVRSPDELTKRRLESAKGEFSRFLDALSRTRDESVRRAWRGLVQSVHKAVITEES